MSWLGKMIGGTIGFALGGPLGAVAGAAFGHTFVDKREESYFKSIPGGRAEDRGLSSNEEAQLVFFTAAFSMLAKISKADGRVSEKEIQAIERFMVQDLQLDAAGRETAKTIFRQAVSSSNSFEAFATQFYTVFRHQPHILELMMDVLFRVSAADGRISHTEENLLRAAVGIFHFSETDFKRLKDKYIPQADPSYAVLKLEKTASNEEIKKQYRAMAREYHPDRIEGKGLPEEFIKLANDKFGEIQDAYEKIRKERGF